MTNFDVAGRRLLGIGCPRFAGMLAVPLECPVDVTGKAPDMIVAVLSAPVAGVDASLARTNCAMVSSALESIPTRVREWPSTTMSGFIDALVGHTRGETGI